MSAFGIADKELSENLFALCLQADAAFEQQMADAFQSANLQIQYDPSKLDHAELITFYIWLGRRVVGEQPKVLNALQAAYFLTSTNSPFSGQDGQKIFQNISQRFFEYDQAMLNAPEKMDVVYVVPTVTQRVFGHIPEVLVHLPKIEIMASRLFAEWAVSVSKTLKELI